MIYEDTYFLDPKEALRVATQQNKMNDGYWLQVCFYDGKKQETNLKNLIHLPLDDFVDTMALAIYRIPTKLDFTGVDVDTALKLSIFTSFQTSIEYATKLREELHKQELINLKNSKLNFNEPLRFYLSGHSNTQVMHHTSQNIADTLTRNGYDVLFDLSCGIEDTSSFKNIMEFNPHVVININHINNYYMNDDVFNFVWFQDAMPVLTNNDKITLRKRDFIFSYQTIFTNLLIKNGVKKKKIFKQQVIPVDIKQFYFDKKVTRENKIIFVGSYYDKRSNYKYMTKNIDQQLELFFSKGKPLTFDNIKKIFSKYNVDVGNDEIYLNRIQQSYGRNISVKWLCSNSNKTIELYGYDWENSENKNITRYYKGAAEKTKLNELYNSSKYVLAASGQLINTQRLGEIVHAGAIPVIYDSRKMTDEKETWDDECLYFKTQKELKYILDNNIEPKKYRTKKMLKYFTYDRFLKIIFKQIKKMESIK